MSSAAFWRDRPTFVTGATGLVGSWLVRGLLDEGADLVCLVRDEVPQSELCRGGAIGRVKVVYGDVTDQKLLERVLGEYEIDTVFHLAAQTIVGIANRNPISTFETNIQGTWSLLEACRRTPTVQQIVVDANLQGRGGAGFPAGLRLVSHWGLRDELASHYGEADGLAKQRMIAKVKK